MSTALTTTINGSVRESARGIAAEDFDGIVRQHQRRVYRLLYMLLRDSDLADTLTQECFLKAYQKRETFRGECRVDTWLLRIATNLARDYGRNRKSAFWKRLVGLEDAGPEDGRPLDVASPQATPERALLAQREAEAVWAATGELSPQQRAIFLLRFAEEMTLEEIAQVVGIREGTVKAHLFRAVSAVKEKLKEQQWR